MTRQSNKVRELIDRLVHKHIIAGFSFSKGHDPLRHKPGHIVQSLPDGDRELLKTLTTEDINDVRWPPEYTK